MSRPLTNTDSPEDEIAVAIGVLLLSETMETAAPFGALRYCGEPLRGENIEVDE